MRLRLALAVSLLGALAAGGVFIHSRRYAVDEEEAALYESVVREVSALNFRRTSAILLSRSGLVRHYDDLAEVERRLRHAHEALTLVPVFVSGPERERLSAAVARSERVRAESEQLVERFKRELAILRNSAGFLTALAREVAHFEPATPEGVALVRSLDSFLRDLLALQMAHDRSATDVAAKALIRLRAEDPRAAEWTAADLALVLRHGEIAVEKTGTVDALVRKLVALPTASEATRTLEVYAGAHRAALARESMYRALLVLLIFLGGAAGAAYVILRLRRAAADLAQSSGELQVAVESLREERNKQAELAQLKSRFVATTSHEFRTPLSVILSSAEMLGAYAERWTVESTERHLAKIRNAAVNMTNMLEDILLLGRAESGRLDYAPAPFSLRGFCDELVSFAQLADGSPRTIQLEVSAVDDLVVADEALLRHALGNLLSNALKYSPPDEVVTFTARVEGAFMHFIVEDRGIGISSDDQKHLFSSFHRGSNVGRIRGSGLGLSIVKHAIDLLHGTIDVTSSLGQGTKVVVRVPMGVGSGAAA